MQYRHFQRTAPIPIEPRSHGSPGIGGPRGSLGSSTTPTLVPNGDGENTDNVPATTGSTAPDPSLTGCPLPGTSNPNEPKPDTARASEKIGPYTYVSFDGPLDESNPQNWKMLYKAWVIAQLTCLTLSLTFASSVSSAAAQGARAELGGSELAGTATTGAFVVGIGLGAMPFAPLSECESTSSCCRLLKQMVRYHLCGPMWYTLEMRLWAQQSNINLFIER